MDPRDSAPKWKCSLLHGSQKRACELVGILIPSRRAGASELRVFRAAVATVFTYVFFARGATGSSLLAGHVTRSVAGVTVQLEHEKGKGKRQRARAITLPPNSVPGLEALLLKWEHFRGAVPDGASYYLLPGERVCTRVPASAVDSWLQTVLAHFGMQPRRVRRGADIACVRARHRPLPR